MELVDGLGLQGIVDYFSKCRMIADKIDQKMGELRAMRYNAAVCLPGINSLIEYDETHNPLPESKPYVDLAREIERGHRVVVRHMDDWQKTRNKFALVDFIFGE